MTISARDYRQIIEVIDAIYTIPDKGAMFSVVSRKLQKLIHIRSAIFIPSNSKTGELLLNGYEMFVTQKKAMLAYLSHYAPQDPFASSGFFENSSNICKRNTELVPERRLIKSEFGNDFLMRVASIFYILAAKLAVQGDAIGIVGFHRNIRQKEFGEREKEIVNTILPHIALAIRNRQLMREFDPFATSDGVIALGGNGQPFYINAEAKLALKDNLMETIREPGLGTQPAFFKSGTESFRIRTVPLGKGGKSGKLIILERHPPEHKLGPKLARFGLSKRENEVCVLVMQGLSNRGIAQKLFITEQTVKDHLHHVFGKIGIHRRGELAARVMGLGPAGEVIL